MEFQDGLSLVRATNEHRAFIHGTWFRSYWQQSKGKLSHSVFADGEPRLIESCYGLCHVLTTDGSSIHGWVCGKMGLLHYVYVPTELRGNGFGSKMVLSLTGVGPDYTRENRWIKQKVKGTFNPYRLQESHR